MVKFLSFEMFNPSEDEINFDSFIKFPLFCCKLVSLTFEPLSANPSFLKQFQFALRLSLCRFFLFITIVTEVSLSMYTVLGAEDFLGAAASAANVLNLLLIMLKVFVSYWQREDIWRIFVELRAISAPRINENAKYKIKEYLDGYHYFIKIYAAAMVGLNTPNFLSIISYLIFGTQKLIVQYWYPFDPDTPENYPYALAWTNVAGWICCTSGVASDALLYALITVVAMEFDIFKIDLMNITFTPPEQRSDELKNLVNRHNKLFEIGGKLQGIYNVTFFVSLVISSLAMCYVAFMLMNAYDVETYGFYVSYLCMVGGQILLLCIYGQKILDSSAAVADGIFYCNWEEIDDIALKKQLLFMIHRAQTPKKLSAIGYIDVTHESFTKVRIFEQFKAV